MKKVLLIFLCIVLSTTLTGCSLQDLLGKKKEKATSKSSQEDQKQIIAVALNDDDPNKVMILKGIEDMAEKEEMEVKVLSAKDIVGGNESKQSKSNGSSKSSGGGKEEESPLKDAKILIYQGGSKEFLQSAQKDKIPILALNELPAGVKAAGIILSDPDQAGELMAQPILNKVAEGHVIFLQGDPGDSAAQEQLAALRRVLSKNSKITVHAISNPAGSESIAKQAILEYLQKNPDKVQVICALNEKLIAQAYEVLKSQQLEKKILLVGGQANLQSLQRMATGSQIADIDTAPYIQGVNAFQWAQKIVNKETLDISESITGDQGEVPAKVIPVKPVTPENLGVVQKSYTQVVEAQKEQEAKKAQEQKSEDKQGKDQKSQSNSKSGQGDKKSQGQENNSAQGGKQSNINMPEGVSKVTEKVRTEITREYLDSQGKVIGTEKNANDQVRTVPPEMLLQEMQQQEKQGGQQQGKDSGGGQEKKDGGGDKKEGEGDKKE